MLLDVVFCVRTFFSKNVFFFEKPRIPVVRVSAKTPLFAFTGVEEFCGCIFVSMRTIQQIVVEVRCIDSSCNYGK